MKGKIVDIVFLCLLLGASHTMLGCGWMLLIVSLRADAALFEGIVYIAAGMFAVTITMVIGRYIFDEPKR